MKAEEIIAYIKVSEKTIIDYKTKIYYDIFNISQKFIDVFKLSVEQTNAIYDYINHHTDIQGVLLYERIKGLAENKDESAYVTLWLSENDRYVVKPTQIPKAYFQSIITEINN